MHTMRFWCPLTISCVTGHSILSLCKHTKNLVSHFCRFTTKNLAEKIKGLQEGQTVDISGLMNLDEKKSQ